LISETLKEEFDKTLQVVTSIKSYHHVNWGGWSPTILKEKFDKTLYVATSTQHCDHANSESPQVIHIYKMNTCIIKTATKKY